MTIFFIKITVLIIDTFFVKIPFQNISKNSLKKNQTPIGKIEKRSKYQKKIERSKKDQKIKKRSKDRKKVKSPNRKGK
jgi:hypothetical protein